MCLNDRKTLQQLRCHCCFFQMVVASCNQIRSRMLINTRVQLKLALLKHISFMSMVILFSYFVSDTSENGKIVIVKLLVKINSQVYEFRARFHIAFIGLNSLILFPHQIQLYSSRIRITESITSFHSVHLLTAA